MTMTHVDHLVDGDVAGLVDLAVEAEHAGVDQIVLTDHVVLGTALDAHDALGGPFPYPPTECYPDPLVTLAAIGARTHRIRLSTGLLIAPLRPAVLLAKMVATLDAISGGRVDLGVGTGWQVEEFDALGVPIEGKAKRMDDTIRACQALWQSRPAAFEAPTVRFEDLYCVPTPANGRSVPIWFGGTANAAMARRVAELGEGWLPMGLPPTDELEKGVALLRSAFEAAGRDPSSFGVRVMLPPQGDPAATLACVPELVAIGVTSVSLPLGALAETRDQVGPVLRALRQTLDATQR